MVQGINDVSGLLSSLNQANNARFKAEVQISTGKRVNTAADDAAGLAQINRFNSQFNGNVQAIRNANDGISLAKTGGGTLDGVTDSIQRIRELSIQSANGILSDADRNTLQQEVAGLQDEIGKTIENAEFNGVKLFSEDGSLNFQVGANEGDQIELGLSNLSQELTDLLAVDISTQEGAQLAIAETDTAIESIVDNQVNLGAFENRLNSTINNLANNNVNTAASRSRIEDADFAKAVTDQATAKTQQEATIAIQAQANANAGLVLRLLSI